MLCYQDRPREGGHYGFVLAVCVVTLRPSRTHLLGVNTVRCAAVGPERRMLDTRRAPVCWLILPASLIAQGTTVPYITGVGEIPVGLLPSQ